MPTSLFSPSYSSNYTNERSRTSASEVAGRLRSWINRLQRSRHLRAHINALSYFLSEGEPPRETHPQQWRQQQQGLPQQFDKPQQQVHLQQELSQQQVQEQQRLQKRQQCRRVAATIHSHFSPSPQRLSTCDFNRHNKNYSSSGESIDQLGNSNSCCCILSSSTAGALSLQSWQPLPHTSDAVLQSCQPNKGCSSSNYGSSGSGSDLGRVDSSNISSNQKLMCNNSNSRGIANSLMRSQRSYHSCSNRRSLHNSSVGFSDARTNTISSCSRNSKCSSCNDTVKVRRTHPGRLVMVAQSTCRNSNRETASIAAAAATVGRSTTLHRKKCAFVSLRSLSMIFCASFSPSINASPQPIAATCFFSATSAVAAACSCAAFASSPSCATTPAARAAAAVFAGAAPGATPATLTFSHAAAAAIAQRLSQKIQNLQLLSSHSTLKGARSASFPPLAFMHASSRRVHACHRYERKRPFPAATRFTVTAPSAAAALRVISPAAAASTAALAEAALSPSSSAAAPLALLFAAPFGAATRVCGQYRQDYNLQRKNSIASPLFSAAVASAPPVKSFPQSAGAVQCYRATAAASRQLKRAAVLVGESSVAEAVPSATSFGVAAYVEDAASPGEETDASVETAAGSVHTAPTTCTEDYSATAAPSTGAVVANASTLFLQQLFPKRPSHIPETVWEKLVEGGLHRCRTNPVGILKRQTEEFFRSENRRLLELQEQQTRPQLLQKPPQQRQQRSSSAVPRKSSLEQQQRQQVQQHGGFQPQHLTKDFDNSSPVAASSATAASLPLRNTFFPSFLLAPAFASTEAAETAVGAAAPSARANTEAAPAADSGAATAAIKLAHARDAAAPASTNRSTQKARVGEEATAAAAETAGPAPYQFFDFSCPVVTVEQNFDSLLVPPDHVSRRPSDTYYLSLETAEKQQPQSNEQQQRQPQQQAKEVLLLRTQGTSHQRELLAAGVQAAIWACEVVRRDAVDRLHYPVFHQVDGFRVFEGSQLQQLQTEHKLLLRTLLAVLPSPRSTNEQVVASAARAAVFATEFAAAAPAAALSFEKGASPPNSPANQERPSLSHNSSLMRNQLEEQLHLTRQTLQQHGRQQRPLFVEGEKLEQRQAEFREQQAEAEGSKETTRAHCCTTTLQFVNQSPCLRWSNPVLLNPVLLHLQVTLENLLRQLFGCSPKMRWDYTATFPFTSPSVELYVATNGSQPELPPSELLQPTSSQQRQQHGSKHLRSPREAQHEQQQVVVVQQPNFKRIIARLDGRESQGEDAEDLQGESQRQKKQLLSLAASDRKQKQTNKEAGAAEDEWIEVLGAGEIKTEILAHFNVAAAVTSGVASKPAALHSASNAAVVASDAHSLPHLGQHQREAQQLSQPHLQQQQRHSLLKEDEHRQCHDKQQPLVHLRSEEIGGHSNSSCAGSHEDSKRRESSIKAANPLLSAAAPANKEPSETKDKEENSECPAMQREREERKLFGSEQRKEGLRICRSKSSSSSNDKLTASLKNSCESSGSNGNSAQTTKREADTLVSTQQRRGWAFGLGLERLCMHLYGIKDIRLFWSKDPRFLSQYADGKPRRFVPFSIMPPVYKDISFWVNNSTHTAGAPATTAIPSVELFNAADRTVKETQQQQDLQRQQPSQQLSGTGDGKVERVKEKKPMQHVFDELAFHELCREVGGDLIEDVTLLDTFVHPQNQRISYCYRLTYRATDRTLLHSEVNALQDAVYRKVGERFDVELR